jgi:hypothetical protein
MPLDITLLVPALNLHQDYRWSKPFCAGGAVTFESLRMLSVLALHRC